MFFNYFKIAFRNIRRQKLYTLINVTDLSIGVATSILFLLFVYEELTTDKFHKNADQIYRVYTLLEDGEKKLPVALTPSALADALKKDYPEVSGAVCYELKPLVLKMAPEETRILVLRIVPGNVKEIFSFIADHLQRVDPDYAFEPEFLTEALNQMYALEQKMMQLFIYSAFIAILISCLGLFGLSAYTTVKRTKEIAIRKACGATTLQIIMMLSVGFIKLVLVSNLIAWPVAYFALNYWLRNYAYHLKPTVTPFLASTALTLIIALLTVGYQAMKTARANPVEALRYE